MAAVTVVIAATTTAVVAAAIDFIPAMTIRNVSIDDAEAIARIYNRYITETTTSFETSPLSVEDMRQRIVELSSIYPYYVAVTDNKVIGYCYVHLWKERAAYRNTLETTIYLDPDVKHKGIGSRLMQQLIEECRKQGYKTLIACVTAENIESREFHSRLGFKQVSLFEGVGCKFGRYLDVADYQLQL